MGEAKNKQENKYHLGLYDTTYRPLISESKPVCCITLEPVSLTLRRSVLGSRVSDTKLLSFNYLPGTYYLNNYEKLARHVLFVVLRNMTEMIHFILGSSIYR